MLLHVLHGGRCRDTEHHGTACNQCKELRCTAVVWVLSVVDTFGVLLPVHTCQRLRQPVVRGGGGVGMYLRWLGLFLEGLCPVVGLVLAYGWAAVWVDQHCHRLFLLRCDFCGCH